VNTRHWLAVGWLGVAMCTSASAATYYVAQEDPRAADTNAGTADQPWLTIRRGLQNLNPGDTVYLKKGVYREFVPLSPTGRDGLPPVPSGTSYQQMTTLAAFPGDEVIIKGSDVITGWTHYTNQIWYTTNAPRPRILPILFCDDQRLNIIGDWGGEMSRMITNMAGSLEVWRGRKGEQLGDLEPNAYFYDKDSNRLYIWLADGSDPNRHRIEMTMRYGVSIEGRYMRVSGLKVLHASTGVGGGYNILENCESSDGSWGGCGVYGEFNTIIGCKFNRNGDSGMGGSGRGHRIINCETSSNNYLRISAGWHSGGCKFIPFCSDIVMSGHIAAYNIESPVIWFDWGNFNVTVENCITHHNGGGIMY